MATQPPMKSLSPVLQSSNKRLLFRQNKINQYRENSITNPSKDEDEMKVKTNNNSQISPILLFISMVSAFYINAQNPEAPYNWKLGEHSEIFWKINSHTVLPHKDHLAMSGQSVDMILEWGVDGLGSFYANRLIRWPMLRTLPDDTHASLQKRLGDSAASSPRIDGKKLSIGTVKTISIRGALKIFSEHREGLQSERIIFPSVLNPTIIDRIRLTNTADRAIEITVPDWKVEETTNEENGLYGVYTIDEFIEGNGIYRLAPRESMTYAVIRTARKSDDAPYFGNSSAEWAARQDFINRSSENLVLETPNPVLDRLFDFSKIRASESIFSTRGGLLHGPGGYNKYLAAIWANDQAEYINPFFPFLGNPVGNISALNSFRHFASYMNPEYKPIPSSIVAEGRSFWGGAGDRGDMAMIAYGAARFALASGNKEYGKELWPLVSWCLEYLRRKELPNGSIASDSDELEGRFPAGKANLSTISLYYDALLSAAFLARELGLDAQLATTYEKQAVKLRRTIGENFGAAVEGFDTYQYYDGNKELRSWICFPLTVGIYDKAKGTVDALFSPKLWTKSGLLTKSRTSTVWDRSTLYALRGVFQAGFMDRGLEKLITFSQNRLLGSHVPYVIEAYPEQNQSHLSAESGLYCRIFIEGIFGIRPTGFSSFECTPNLPSDWDDISLKNIHAFGMKWNIEVYRNNDLIGVSILDGTGKSIYKKELSKEGVHHIDFDILID